jgi:type VI secretion system protein VasD
MIRRTFLASALPVMAFALAAAPLAGCGGPPPPATLALTISAGADQNPDPSNAPLPVKILLFQLGATGKFQSADWTQLADNAKATLGEDMLANDAVVVAPGEQKVINTQLKSGAQALGVAVLFRNIDNATWRLVGKLATTGANQLTLTTKGIVATLAPS